MKKIISIIVYFSISYSYFLQSSYPPISDKALYPELNVIRQSLVSSNTPNNSETIEEFNQELSEEKSMPFLQRLYQYGAFEAINFSLNCTNNLNTITIAAYHISVNNFLKYKQKEFLLLLAHSKMYPRQEKIFFEEPLTNEQKIYLRVTHGIVFNQNLFSRHIEIYAVD